MENLKFVNLSLFYFISAFEEEFNRKLITLISADCFIENSNVYDFRVEIFVMPECKSFWFQKNLFNFDEVSITFLWDLE